ncbi:hypothetical protein K438DRAFT_2079714 [Mycena galopus ATCC 62051]|nr:hypothetical protein K438DRAFT_2079714 [Mycena galopus ATCC 62051]
MKTRDVLKCENSQKVHTKHKPSATSHQRCDGESWLDSRLEVPAHESQRIAVSRAARMLRDAERRAGIKWKIDDERRRVWLGLTLRSPFLSLNFSCRPSRTFGDRGISIHTRQRERYPCVPPTSLPDSAPLRVHVASWCLRRYGLFFIKTVIAAAGELGPRGFSYCVFASGTRDHRMKDQECGGFGGRFKEENIKGNLPLVEALGRMAKNKGITFAQRKRRARWKPGGRGGTAKLTELTETVAKHGVKGDQGTGLTDEQQHYLG